MARDDDGNDIQKTIRDRLKGASNRRDPKSGFKKTKTTKSSTRIPGSQVNDIIDSGSTPPKESVRTQGRRTDGSSAPSNLSNKGSQNTVVKESGQSSKSGGINTFSGRSSEKDDPKSQSGKPPSLAEKVVSKSQSQARVNADAAFSDGAKVKKGSQNSVVNAKQDSSKGTSNFEQLVNGSTNDKTKHKVDIDDEHQIRLQYRIPKDLKRLYKNDPEKLKKLSKWFMKQIDAAEDDRRVFLSDRLPKFRKQLLDFVSAGLAQVFEGQHDIHIPLAFEKAKAMHARIFQAVFGIDPIFSLKPRPAVSSQRKEAKEQLLNFIIKSYANSHTGLAEVLDQDIWNFVADGTAVTRHWWKKDVRKYIDTEDIIDEDGEESSVEVKKDTVVFDGPMLSTVPLEDFYMVGEKNTDVDSLELIAERQRFTKSDLIKQGRLGFFDPDTVEEVINHIEPNLRNDISDSDSIIHSNVKEQMSGFRNNNKLSGSKTYTVFEGYFRFDIDDDGVDEELVVWIERNSKMVLRITHLERVGPGGRRPFVIKRFFSREDSPYGIGLGEMLYGINNEVDYIHNLRLDSAVFQVLPMFVYRKSSNLGKERKDIRLKPGGGIGVEDPNSDIAFPKLSTNLNFTYQEEQNLNRVADGVSSINPLAMGQISGQGATRTATGTAAVVAAADALLDISIKRYQTGLTRNFEILDRQVIDLLPKGTAIRITGPTGVEETRLFKNRDELAFDADFELEANSATSNKAVERELTNVIFQTSMNPILIQSGVVGPEEIRNSYIDFLKANERKNIQRYVAGPEEGILPKRSAKDELTMILMGVKPEVMLNDRHAEKLALFEEFEQSEDGLGLLESEEQLQLYLETKQVHERFQAALEAQANQASQAGFTAPVQTASIAAGAGNPQGGVPNQIGDLLGQALQPPGGQ